MDCNGSIAAVVDVVEIVVSQGVLNGIRPYGHRPTRFKLAGTYIDPRRVMPPTTLAVRFAATAAVPTRLVNGRVWSYPRTVDTLSGDFVSSNGSGAL